MFRIQDDTPLAIGCPRAATPRSKWWHTLPARLRNVATTVGCLMERGRQRRALADLDDRLLRDIGLTGADVRDEHTKPIWLR